MSSIGTVVICSKFITFVVEMTTKRGVNTSLYRCDLLKIHYLCGWNDNPPDCKLATWRVVICSKFITFVVEMTTGCRRTSSTNMLWFAQNSLPLWLKWQLKSIWFSWNFCCDLLKIHYLCGWNDNLNSPLPTALPVVICSKFITFVVEMTTIGQMSLFNWMLWFAQNSLPLWLKWQPGCGIVHLSVCCDLLKIHYLCGWNDNEG